MRAYRKAGRRTDRQTDGQTETDGQTRRTDRDGQTETDGQTDRQTDRVVSNTEATMMPASTQGHTPSTMRDQAHPQNGRGNNRKTAVQMAHLQQ